MDDTLARQYFADPRQAFHIRFLALRSFFLDGLSFETIAQQFDVTYHTIRSWVRDFRALCQSGQLPPFSPSRDWADPLTASDRTFPRHALNHLPRRILVV